jgi:long-chain acyl-CoA synthetase
MITIKGEALLPFKENFQDLREILDYAIRTYPDKAAYRFRRVPEGEIYTKTFRDLKQDIGRFGAGLLNLGIRPKEGRIVTIGANCYEWIIASNGALFGAGLSIPIDRQLPEQEVLLLTERSRADVFIYHKAHLPVALYVAENNPQIKYFISMQDDGLPENRNDRFFLMQDVADSATTEQIEAFFNLPIERDKMASLIFTSGTTAVSKGVMLSQRNLAANVTSIMKTLKVRPGEERALSVLPLHHTFENTVGVYAFWAYGVCSCQLDGLRYLAQNLQEYKITVMISVPLLMENICRQIRKNAAKKGKLKTIDRLIPILRFLKKIGIDLRRKVFAEIHDALGGELELSVVGAAALDPKVERFLSDIGITCWGGYGLSEASPVVAACNQSIYVTGSVGRPLADITVAIDDEHGRDLDHAGEILVKGDNVMLGYYDNEEATKETLRDGWLHTGDVGYIGKNDCLFITGRVKSMIVLANGKKAFPEEIETLLNRIPGIAESFVWGESNQRDHVDIAALIRLDPENVPPDVKSDEDIRTWLAEQINDVNHGMPTFRRIKYFLFTEDDFTKTTTLKVKRSEQLKRVNSTLAASDIALAKAQGKRIRDDLLV